VLFYLLFCLFPTKEKEQSQQKECKNIKDNQKQSNLSFCLENCHNYYFNMLANFNSNTEQRYARRSASGFDCESFG
jgi:hypothetical protein